MHACVLRSCLRSVQSGVSQLSWWKSAALIFRWYIQQQQPYLCIYCSYIACHFYVCTHTLHWVSMAYYVQCIRCTSTSHVLTAPTAVELCIQYCNAHTIVRNYCLLFPMDITPISINPNGNQWWLFWKVVEAYKRSRASEQVHAHNPVFSKFTMRSSYFRNFLYLLFILALRTSEACVKIVFTILSLPRPHLLPACDPVFCSSSWAVKRPIAQTSSKTAIYTCT